MKTRFHIISLFSLLTLAMAGCDTDPVDETGPQLVFRFKFDPTQERLNNFGQPSTIPQGNAAQSPVFKKMSAHYVEMVTTAFTQLGQGQVLYYAPETSAGGSTAIDFEKSVVVSEGEVFLSVPLSSIAPGTYPYIRVSLSYQQYDIKFNASGYNQLTGTLASFIGYKTYIKKYRIGEEEVTVNNNELQGYWGFETVVPVPGWGNYVSVTEGRVPAGAITVPNALAATSPIPPGSCLVTGNFEVPLQITGSETENIEVRISISTNNSFEWSDADGNGQYDPLDGNVPVDMGVRGLKAIVQ